MHIEIVTTKKKLSKSIVNQMEVFYDTRLINLKCVGLLINCRKDIPRALLLQRENGSYCIASASAYIEDETHLHPVNYRSWINFNTKKECDKWFEKYTSVVRGAVQIYI